MESKDNWFKTVLRIEVATLLGVVTLGAVALGGGLAYEALKPRSEPVASSIDGRWTDAQILAEQEACRRKPGSCKSFPLTEKQFRASWNAKFNHGPPPDVVIPEEFKRAPDASAR
jgi:hypothetical protein